MGLALADDDSPIIASVDELPDLGVEVARRDGSEWSIDVVESGVQVPPSLAPDSAGNVAMSYTHGGQVKLARHDVTAWTVESVDAGSSGTSLVLDSSATRT